MLTEKGHNLDGLLAHRIREFEYEYDFGDGWEHRIIVEATHKPVADWSYPLCVAGERACPPEDVGGPPGYERFLEAIADPKHREHDHMLAWVGGVFDPEGFDINAVIGSFADGVCDWPFDWLRSGGSVRSKLQSIR